MRFINYMQDPYVQAREASVHGYAPTDSRAIALQPDSLAVIRFCILLLN